MNVANPGIPQSVSRACDALGRGVPAAIRRLQGGTCKGVYRAWWTDGRSAIVYRWHPDEDRWGLADGAEDTGAPSRIDFLSAQQLLSAVGVRVPTVLHENAGLHDVDATVVVEDFGDRRLGDILAGSDEGRDPVLAAFGTVLRTLHAQQRDEPGPIVLASDRTTTPPPFADQILQRAHRHLKAARHHPAIQPIELRLRSMLHEAHRRVHPRVGATLVHGELGPDHVLVDADGQPCLIDIEGCNYADLEWEHAYLALRFGPHYEHLQRDDLDPARLELYTLALHLSLVAGPSELLTRTGPDPFMQSIVAHNAQRLIDLATG
jgi:hypothetical protein